MAKHSSTLPADDATPPGGDPSPEQEKDPDEQESLARDLGEELTDVFARYVRGDVDFADLTFLTFETLQDLHIIASGAYEIEFDDDDAVPDDTDHYDPAEATDQQEDLAQEPSRS